MLTIEVFRDRVTALWNSQKKMAEPKKWKSGSRAGAVRKQAALIQFTKPELERWLWSSVGLNAIPCPYCRVPIDIVSLTLDHIYPRSAGGEFSLANMQVICTDCNAMKGDLSHEAFLKVLELSRSFSQYDQGKFLSRLKAAHHGSAARFFRKPAGPKQSTPPPRQNPMNFDLGTF